MTKKQNHQAWEELRARLAANDSLAGVSIPRRMGFPHPRDAGARTTATWPVGQTADYCIEGPPGEPGLAVREYDDRFEAFLDTVRITTRAVEAAEHDPEKALYIGAAMVGGALGASTSNKREGVLLGAGLGLLFAALLNSGSNRTR
ncbi:hypothetical protein KEG38_20290 [Polyangium jinanense]|uniref:hypothetical protein n=1 Tax=Polyangium jinanense TaxID=2829994 RepID=UPI0023413889|nr:hypothetical protein [Polyangium jinanense]MDC3956212.1 hypothetical protein [Polyangium jinanense]